MCVSFKVGFRSDCSHITYFYRGENSSSERSGGWKRVRKLAIEDSPLSRSFFSNRCIFAFIDRFIFPVNEISYTRIRILFELRRDRNMDISSLRNEFRKLISRIKYILSLKIFYPIQALIYIFMSRSCDTNSSEKEKEKKNSTKFKM